MDPDSVPIHWRTMRWKETVEPGISRVTYKWWAWPLAPFVIAKVDLAYRWERNKWRRIDYPNRRWYRHWAVHNLVAHPLSEILHWLGLGDLGNRIHDATLPVHEEGTGRG